VNASTSARTAIQRKGPSLPARWISSRGYLSGYRCLDYGCGRGQDARWLGIEGYDPAYQPGRPVGPYNVILCTYVLNTVTPEEQRYIMGRIGFLLTPNGTAYLTVRRDIPEAGTATQRYVRLALESVRRTATYEIYCASPKALEFFSR
jgi:hypothetical protein